MKKINVLLIALISPFLMWAQNGINYQAVVRDGAGVLLTNQSITAGFEIQETMAGGTVVYSETHAVTTNDYGLINVIIGEGTLVSGDFTIIDWGADKHFVAVSIDGNLMGTTEFKYVPYSIHAQQMTNIKANTSIADLEMTSSDDHALLHLRPTANISNDSSSIFLGEGFTAVNGMTIRYEGIGNNMKIMSFDGTNPADEMVTFNRDSQISTFKKGVVVNETTSTPTPNTTYGNSGPLAYAYINGTTLTTDYGITSVTETSTGVFEIILDNNWVTRPAVVCTSFNLSSDTEIVTYSTTGTNTITVRIVDEANVATTSNFSIVVYGTAQ